MYCSNCGSKIDDDSLFCPNCGTRTAASGAPVSTPVPPVQAETPEPAAPKKKLSKGVLIGIIAGAAAVVAAVVLLVVLLGGRGGSSWEKVAEKALNADVNVNVSDMLDTCMPDKVLDALLKENGMTKADYNSRVKAMQAEYDEYMQDESYGEYRKSVKFEVTGGQPMDANEVEELNEYYNRHYNTPMDYISEGMIAHVAYSNEWVSGEDMEIRLVKIDGTWYISLDEGIGLIYEIFDNY